MKTKVKSAKSAPETSWSETELQNKPNLRVWFAPAQISGTVYMFADDTQVYLSVPKSAATKDWSLSTWKPESPNQDRNPGIVERLSYV